jgi:hypothetical protein
MYQLCRAQHCFSFFFSMFLFFNPSFAQEEIFTNSLPASNAQPPTDAQLKLGQELLDKIAFVVENVPLQDAAAVMKIFGFTKLYTWTYPTYIRVQPIGRMTKSALPTDLEGTGFSYIHVDPWVQAEKYKRSAGVAAKFTESEACITVDAVRERFGGAINTVHSPTFETCCIPNRPKVGDTDAISFGPLQTPRGMIGLIGFVFKYQSCARDFGFSYKITEETK